jgi:diguanylate cyclase (GGDEF)-like protein
MKTTNDSPAPDVRLARVVGQGRRVQGLMLECAEDLSSVNSVLRNELTEQKPLPEVEQALEMSEVVEDMVQEASGELSSMNRALRIEIRERRSLESRLEAASDQGEADRHASLHDELTGLPNRTLFRDRLEHGLVQAARHGWTLAVMFVDLDGFKGINDSHGHEAGDGVLRAVAHRLRQGTREEDTVSRYGGDEFLCLLADVKDEKDISAIAVKLTDAIRAPCDVGSGETVTRLRVGASIGISIFPKDGTTAEQLIGSADAAMYLAKRSVSGHAFAGP